VKAITSSDVEARIENARNFSQAAGDAADAVKEEEEPEEMTEKEKKRARKYAKLKAMMSGTKDSFKKA